MVSGHQSDGANADAEEATTIKRLKEITDNVTQIEDDIIELMTDNGDEDSEKLLLHIIGKGTQMLIAAIPVVGPILAPLAEPVLDQLLPEVAFSIAYF